MEPPAGTDPLLIAGITGSVAGGVFLLSGAIFAGAKSGPEQYCGITGCVDRPRPVDENTIASLVGAGAGLGAVGLGSLLGAIGNPLRNGDRHRNIPELASGFALTSVGAALLGLGFGQAATYGLETDLSTAAPWFVAGGALLATGLPLFVAGARHDSVDERRARAARDRLLADPSVPKRHHSKSMMTAGIVLTSLSGLGAIGGTAIVVVDAATDSGGFYSVIMGLPTLGTSVILSSIGVPLIVAGARREVPGDAYDGRAASLPDIDLQGAGLRATWRLP